ncbi:hypothetical protein KFE25_002596 [Diacronema lutheri]|uniref:Uncharacterized protein n=2 Tax=Diacronema lutheri TaxID=2081491 RepID=A0A8J5XRJ8_DIALT|nr:hypothetical protein KFE25_002596 [Diacronema lutheri]
MATMRFSRAAFGVLALLVSGAAAFQPGAVRQPRCAPTARASWASPPARAFSQRAAVSAMADNNRQSPYEGWPTFVRPDTNGGAIGLTLLGIVLPWGLYSLLVSSGMDSIRVGQIFIVGYVGIGTIAWTLSYVLRVANKDTTYAQQLKEYETAVLEKRLEELDEGEIEALMAEVDKEELS